MKIREVGTSQVDANAPHGAAHTKPTDSAVSFKREMTALGAQEYEKHIKQMTDDIFAQGERVAKKADIKELQKYREMITKLLNETVSNSYEFSKSANLDRRGRHRVFATINKINDTLDEMTKDILEGQKDNLNLLNKVDDIRGMLVDLFL